MLRLQLDDRQRWGGDANVENGYIGQVLTEMRADMAEMRRELARMSERTAILESWRENTKTRHTAMPGWIIAGVGLVFSAISVIGSLWAAGRIP